MSNTINLRLMRVSQYDNPNAPFLFHDLIIAPETTEDLKKLELLKKTAPTKIKISF